MIHPRVSIVIPVHNRTEYLADAIRSVKNQDYENYEVIVIDDGSTQNQEVIKAICEDHGLKYFRQRKQGVSAARNMGIKVSSGEYIVFLDADDRILTHKLKSQAEFLEQHPEVGVVYSDGYIFRVNSDGTEDRVLFSENGFIDKSLGEAAHPLYRLVIRNSFPIHAAMTRRSSLDKTEYFDEKIQTYEDWDLWLRVACYSRFAYLDELVAEYRVAPGNVSRDERLMLAGYETVQRKIFDLEAFESLPNWLKAEVYYQYGMSALYQHRAHEASSRFKKAFLVHNRHYQSLAGFFLTRFLGHHSIRIYRFKQSMFGTRTRVKRPFSWSTQ